MKTLFLFLFFLVTNYLAAQNKYLVINGGLSINTSYFTLADSVITTNNTVGYNASFKYKHSINQNISVSSGLSMLSKGYKINSISSKIKYIFHHIEIPIDFELQFEIGEPIIFFSGGGFLSGAIGGSVYDGNNKSNIRFGFGEGMFKTFDYGVSIGWGLEFNPIIIGMNYSIGLRDIASSSIDEIYNRGVKVFIGYKFNM